jgi:hypothetical protein
MPNYYWVNSKTEEVREVFASISNRDIPPDDSGDWSRPPVVVNFTKVSYLDGAKRDGQAGFDKLKVASQLEIDKASSTDKGERARLGREIKRLTEV